MADKFDFKKEYKDLYLPKTKPCIIDIPQMIFIMIDGKGDPNTSSEYKNALEILYGLSYSIKMSKMNGTQPQGYFEYVIPPLEGFWCVEDGYFDGSNIIDKNKFTWMAVIRQPDFVTPAVFEMAKHALLKKKPGLDFSQARLTSFTEGLCAQIMHLGSYDDEPATIAIMEKFIVDSGYKNDISATRKHHEIYLSDPRKTAPEKLKTVIRHPIANFT
ncbi:MAG: GyrI-like domain-containing protein [Lachnospiraceae bacterium]|nr:GyrI-like domain-containing protein [Lachnospiraceae bacterium]